MIRLAALAAIVVAAVPATAQEFSELAARCAPAVAPETLAAVARVESGFAPLSIHDNTSKRSYRPQDKAEAISIARRLLNDGHSLDVGLMQVNNHNFAWTGLTLEDAFEACRSIRAGAAILTSFSQYNTGSPRDGFANGYVARVVNASLEHQNQQTGLVKIRRLPQGGAGSFPEPHPPVTSTVSAGDVNQANPFSTESPNGSSFLITNFEEK